MELVRHPEDLIPYASGSFVPTMGALHEGHLSLTRQAAALGRPVVVSVFVNPTQFGPNEDFSRYPRNLDADAIAAGAAGADVVFAPEVDVIYPPGDRTPIPPLPAVATEPKLEDAFRPTHLAGVCQVVARLFDLVRPRRAIFGEKDYQQLKVLTAMARQEGDRWPDLEILPGRTVREPDGLAMSSRNAYLEPAERDRALSLWRALTEAQSTTMPGEAEETMERVLNQSRLDVDYAAVRDAETLMPIETLDRPARALIAARLGQVRLIDNIAMGPRQSA